MDSHCLSDPLVSPARAIARGAIAALPFGNVTALVSASDAAATARMAYVRGRAPDVPGSIVTTWPHLPTLFDWSHLPDGLDSEAVMEIIDTLFAEGPFGFRGPASRLIPAHLAGWDGGIRTAQIIGPGYACPSNKLLEATIAEQRSGLLHVSAAGGSVPPFPEGVPGLVIEDRQETPAAARYPGFAVARPTILSFQRFGPNDTRGRPTLIVERQGSLPIATLAGIIGCWGFGLAVVREAEPAQLAPSERKVA
jgi:hypothetical protein